jgi:hypothetical protein
MFTSRFRSPRVSLRGVRFILPALAAALVLAAPAGAQIVHEASGGLWAMNDNGSDAHLWMSEGQVPQASGGLSSPSVSPDGRTVVFTGALPDGGIWSTGLYKWQAGKVTRLSPAPGPAGTGTLSVQTLAAQDPDVGPDGQVYYERRWHVLGSIYTGDHAAIWRQSLSDIGGQGVDMNVCQIPDIGFGTPDDVNIGDPAANPQWEGSFAYGGCYQVTAPFHDTTLLRISDASNGEFTAIQDSDGWELSDPSWGPDGAQLVFVRDHGTAGGPHELRVAFWDGANWSERLLYSGANAVYSPRFAGDRIIFAESNRFPNADPCTDCGIGIRSIPVSCSSCTEPASTILAHAHNSDLLDPAWTNATLPRTAVAVASKDGVGVLRGQNVRGALSKGLRLAVVCNTGCIAGASASIDGTLARRTGLLSGHSKGRSVQVAKGSLRMGSGARMLTLRFSARPQKALRNLKSLKVAVVVRCLNGNHLTTYKGTITLRR